MSSSASTLPDVNRGPEMIAICGTLVGLTLVIVLARLWVRVRIAQLGWDDHFIAAATVCLVAEFVIIIFEVLHGAGRHDEYVQPKSEIAVALHFNFASQPLCLISTNLTKVSVAIFLTRLTPSIHYHRFVWVVTALAVIAATMNMLAILFQCYPMEFTWDGSVGGECLSPDILRIPVYINSAIAIFSDWAFALLPIPMLWNIQMNRKLKAAVVAVLSLGIFASASSIVRMPYISSYGSRGDFLWDATPITIWTTVEICTGMIAASVPSLKPVFEAMLSSSPTDSHHNHRSGAKGYIMPNDFEMHVIRTIGSHPTNNSDEMSLALAYEQGIRKTIEVSVSVSSSTRSRAAMDSEFGLPPGM